MPSRFIVLFTVIIFCFLTNGIHVEGGNCFEDKQYQHELPPILKEKYMLISAMIYPTIDDNNRIVVTLKITNDSEQTLEIPFWFVFRDGLHDDFFMIVNEKCEKAAYTGMLVRRGVPTEKQMVHIAPGTTAESTVVLNEYYNIPEFRFLTIQYINYMFINSYQVKVFKPQ